MWSYVNSQKKNGCGIPDVMKLGNKVATTNQEAADLFADYFASVYRDDELNAASYPTEEVTESIISSLEIPMHRIHDKLRTLDSNKATGPDGLPPFFFKRHAVALTYPLYVLYNKSLSTGIFSTCYKIAHVVPIRLRYHKL